VVTFNHNKLDKFGL